MTTPEPTRSPEVAVLVVTHNEAADLPGCFEHVRRQTHRPLSLVVVDCASTDESLAVARAEDLGDISKTVVDAAANLGFAGGMNLAAAQTDAPFVLTLNADVRLGDDYIARLLTHLRDAESRAGAVTGRLRRFESSDGPPRLDACGMRLMRSWRHLDRASGAPDRGQLVTVERVFGATGAAALFARRALDDVRFPEALFPEAPAAALFDPDFFTFREDAELCLRLQARGWDVVYEPSARARHRRANLPSRRRSMSTAVNFHGVKNRFLLRAYHQTRASRLRTFVPTLGRDLLVIAYVALVERTSLAAFAWLWRHRRTIRARRRFIQQRRRAEIAHWFTTDALPMRREAP